MKRAIAVSLVLTLLISALTATLLIGNATASVPAEFETRELLVSVTSPMSGKAYGTTEIPLQFYALVRAPFRRTGSYTYDYHGYYELLSVKYWLDEKWMGEYSGEDLSKAYSVVLSGLSDGEHSVKVWMKVSAVMMGEPSGYSNTIFFTVDTSAPSVRVLTSQVTFEASGSSAVVPASFTVDGSVSWVGYSLDGKNVVTVTDQVTTTERFGLTNCQLVLRGLSAGTHSLRVYAEDLAGNRGESEPYTFTVLQQTLSESGQVQPEAERSEPFLIVWVSAALIASAAVVSFGLLAYFLRRKKKRHQLVKA
jgi:hypothetical protein